MVATHDDFLKMEYDSTWRFLKNYPKRSCNFSPMLYLLIAVAVGRIQIFFFFFKTGRIESEKYLIRKMKIWCIFRRQFVT